MKKAINHLMFDLDNTIYPATSDMDKGITRRMHQFIAQFLDVSIDEAEKLRSQRLPHYSTTLEWLRFDKGLTDIEGYFRFVHPEEERAELTPDGKLRPLLQSLKDEGYTLSILTNGPECHASRVIDFFGIRDLFAAISTLETNGLAGKPAPDAYLRTIKAAGSTLEKTVFFDDLTKYTRGFEAIGGRAVLVSGRFLPPAEISSIHDLPQLLAMLNS